MKHRVQVYEYFEEVAKARRPLPLIETFEVEAPEGDAARAVVRAEVVKRTGRVLRGLNHLVDGGFSAIVYLPKG